MRKGISPLVSWVLLISFTIAIGFLVTKWTTEQFSNINFLEDRDGFCDDVEFSVDSVCIESNGNNVRINVSNSGAFSIRRVGITRTTTNFSDNGCIYLNANLLPGNESVLIYKASYSNSDPNVVARSLGEADCKLDIGTAQGIPFDISHQLIKLELVPWIVIEDEPIHCVDKRIILNNAIELNSIC